MKSWVGQPVDNVVAAWGAPDSRMDRSDGGATYTWVNASSDRYGVHQCRQTFTTDSRRVIVGWSYNNCPKIVRRW